MRLKTLTIFLFAALLFSCSAHAGPRKIHYQAHHGVYHFKQQRHHHHKHNYRKHAHRHQAHYRGAAYTPAYIVPQRELAFRYGFPAGEAVIIYRSLQGY